MRSYHHHCDGVIERGSIELGWVVLSLENGLPDSHDTVHHLVSTTPSLLPSQPHGLHLHLNKDPVHIYIQLQYNG